MLWNREDSGRNSRHAEWELYAGAKNNRDRRNKKERQITNKGRM